MRGSYSRMMYDGYRGSAGAAKGYVIVYCGGRGQGCKGALAIVCYHCTELPEFDLHNLEGAVAPAVRHNQF